MSRKIIAFGHQKGVGKDQMVKFCFNILRPQVRGLRIEARGFATKVYEFCQSVYGWAGFQTKAYYDDNPARKNDVLKTGKTVRQTLIDVGQHMRKYDNEIWLNALLLTQDVDILFITDLRFPTEFNGVREQGGMLVRITRPGLPEPTDEADTALNGWEDKWDLTYQNNGTLDGLYTLAEIFCKEYILK